MKKLILPLLLLIMAPSVFAQEEIEGANSTDEKVIAQVVRESRSKDFNHWMLSIGGGFNLMMVERDETPDRPIKSYGDNFQGAGYFNVGYMFDPVWGIVAEYGFVPINKKIFTPEGDVTGFGHEATIQLDFNILNLVRKCRSNTKWNIDALIGAGVLAYNSRYQMNAETNEKDHYYYPAICIPLTLKFQYCPIDELGIGLRLSGKWCSEDNVNYIQGGHNNDMALYCGLELQYNITTKGKSHVRVTDRCTYEPMNVVLEGKIVDVNKNAEKIQQMEEELESVKEEIAVLNGTATEPRKAAPKQAVKEEPQQPQQPQQQVAGTFVSDRQYDALYKDVQDLKGQTKALNNDVQEIKGQMENLRQQLYMSNGTDENTVYFDFDSYTVKPYYELVLAKVARNMLKDKEISIELVSYCDKEGSDEYNKALGQKRVEAVYNILINKFKVEKNRVKIRYEGQVKDDWDAYNRRCDILYK